MTCIVGLVDDKGVVWIGGDSAGVVPESLDLMIRADEKVFMNGAAIFGFTSSFRMGQILRYCFRLPPIAENQDLMEYMVMGFVENMRSAFKEGGLLQTEGRGPGAFLVGIRGKLFQIESDFQVAEPSDGYTAVGSGAGAAKGALYVTQGMKPEHRVTTALMAATRHNCGVCGPFVVKRLEPVRLQDTGQIRVIGKKQKSNSVGVEVVTLGAEASI